MNPVRLMAVAGILCLMLSGPSAAQTLPAPKSSEPIRITARKMEVKSEQNTVVFEQNVVVIQGNITITCDRLRIVTAKGEAKAESPGAEPKGEPRSENRKIQEMIATGNVNFREYFPEEKVERFATGDKAQYWDEEGKLVLTGNPKAWENDNIVTGETMTFFTRTNLFLVDGQVKVVFYPEKGQGIPTGVKPAPAGETTAPAPTSGAGEPTATPGSAPAGDAEKEGGTSGAPPAGSSDSEAPAPRKVPAGP